jgi:chemotaxis protein CheX
MATEFSCEILTEVVGSVFETMMNLEVASSRMPWVPRADCLTSAVHMAGAWNGAFLLECDRGEARRFAGRFLSIDPPKSVNDEVISVLGELANMIGGNMKCAITEGSVLSMPSVTEGNGVMFDGVEVQDRLAFQCEEGNFWITVLAEPSPGIHHNSNLRSIRGRIMPG